MLEERCQHRSHECHSVLHLRQGDSTRALIREGRVDPKEDLILSTLLHLGRVLFWIRVRTVSRHFRMIVIWSYRKSQQSLPLIITQWCSGGGSDSKNSNVSREKVL